jgi:hypothetical protein
VSLLFGNGDGTFASPAALVATRRPLAVRASDVNRDGLVDLVTVNEDAMNGMLVYRATAARTYLVGPTGPPTTGGRFPSGTLPAAIALRDVDGDGLLDALVADRVSDRVVIRPARASTPFFNPIVSSCPYFGCLPAGRTPFDLAGADFDDDGAYDIAAVNRGGGTLSVALNGLETEVMRGDLNADGLVSIADSTAMMRLLQQGAAGQAIEEAVRLEVAPHLGADADGDGELTGADAIGVVARLHRAERQSFQPCVENCARLEVGGGAAIPNGVVRIPVSFTPAADDGGPGGADEVAALAFSLAIPGFELASCDDRTANGVTEAIDVPEAIADGFRVVVVNTGCSGRDRCLCPGSGQERDTVMTVALFGPRDLTGDEAPVPLPAGELLAVDLRLRDDVSGTLPLHVFSTAADQEQMSLPPGAVQLSMGDVESIDQTADRDAGVNRIEIVMGSVEVLPSPTPTITPTSTDTATPTETPTITATPTVTDTVTVTDTPTVTATPTETPVPTSTVTPGDTATPTASATASPTTVESSTVVPTATAEGQTETPTVPSGSATMTPPEVTPTEGTPPTPGDTPTVTPTPLTVQIPGDANCDERLSAADLPAIVALLPSGGLGPCGLADANEDETLDAADLALVTAHLFASTP